LVNGQDSPSQTWRDLMASAAARKVPVRPVGVDLPRQPDDGPWQVLWPDRAVVAPKRQRHRHRRATWTLDTNGASVVLRVEDWLLLTGDLPKKGEQALLRRGLLPIEVLKAGHHGSHGSSSPAFLRRSRPQQVLLSCGAHNRYGHPSAAALQAFGPATLWRTDLQGCVLLRRRAGEPLQIEPWRPALPAALAQPAPRYVSPWRGLKAPENEGQNESDADGDAA
jgi:competence protein ComEC